MINKENIPKGKFEFDKQLILNVNDDAYFDITHFYGQPHEINSTLLFIEQAFNVFSETGMTPKDLHRELNTKVKHNLTKHKINISLQKEIEQLQQEREGLSNLLNALSNYGNTGEDAVAMKDEIRVFLKSLTTQQEEKPFGHDAPYDPEAV